jgi:hypothetical protein
MQTNVTRNGELNEQKEFGIEDNDSFWLLQRSDRTITTVDPVEAKDGQRDY